MNSGYHIIQLRENANLKQSYVAFKAGIPIRTYQRIEAGQSPLTEERLHKLSRVLNTPPEVILGIRTDPPGPDHRDLLIQSLQAQVQLLEDKLQQAGSGFKTVS